MIGCLVTPLLMKKNTRWKGLEVDLEGSLGGLETTRGRVSRMEVREGTMKLPESVRSQ